MDKKKKIGLVIIIACLICTVFYTYSSQKNEHIIYKGSKQKVIEKKDDEFCIGVSQISDSIHPYKQDNETMDILLTLVYEPLAYIGKDATITYKNAKKIVFEKQGKQARVQIDTSKKYSNGTKLTADLVLESYQWFLNHDTAYKKILNHIESIEKIDKKTLLFTFKDIDFQNIEIFNLPLIYQEDKESYYGQTFLGTGPYKISSISPYQEVIMNRNTHSKEKGSYDKVIIKMIDYSKIDQFIKKQEIDMFVINKEEHYERIQESGAYDVYQFDEKEKGYYLVYNIEKKTQRNALAKMVEGESFFEDTQEKGMYSRGIVSAYKKEYHYYSLIQSGNLDGINSLTIHHDIDATSLSIYQGLSQRLKDQKINCSEVKTVMDGMIGFKDDILIYRGNYLDVLSKENAEDFFKDNSHMEGNQFYDELESYLASQNIMTPLSKETTWIACLTTRNTLGLFE